MLYKKYDFEKRTNFVISGEEFEDVSIFDNDINRIKTMLNQKYKNEILDLAPYHFIITKNGVFEIKSTELAHNDNSFLSSFNNDIRFLLVGSRGLLTSMKKEISECIAKISSKYCMRISGNIILVSNDFVKAKDSISGIVAESLKIRGEINNTMSIYECIIGENIFINKKIIMLSNRYGFNKLKLYSDRFSIPFNIIKDLNPHLNAESLSINDIIFVPSVTSIAGRLIAEYCKKQSNFIYGKCRYLAAREVGVDG